MVNSHLLGDAAFPSVGRGAAFGDIDNDGDMDCVISNNNGPANLLMKTGLTENNWIGFELVGTSCNRDAIGAKITVETTHSIQTAFVNPGASYLASNDKRIVFGLNKINELDAIHVDWPGGKRQRVNVQEINRYHRIVQGE